MSASSSFAKISISLITISVISFTLPLATAAPYQREIHTLRRDVEAEANALVRAIVGEEKAIVTARIRTNPRRAPSAPNTSSDANPVIDLGYVPVPMQTPITLAPDPNSLDITSLELDVKLSAKVTEDSANFVKKSIESQFAEFRPRVTLTRIPSLPESSPTRELAQVDQEQTLFEKQWPFLAALIAGLTLVFWGASALLVRGFLVLGRNISENLKLTTGASTHLLQKDHAALKTESQLSSQLSKISLPASKQRKQEFKYSSLPYAPETFKRNLEFVRATLMESPAIFFAQLSLTGNDPAGLVALIPLLTATEQKQLQITINADWRAQLHSIGQTNPGKKPLDSALWMQSLVDRIAMAKLAGKRDLREILGKDRVTELLRADSDSLLRAAKAENSPAIWRLTTEIIAPEKLRSVVKIDELPILSSMLRSAEVSEDALVGAADTLIDRLRNLTTQLREEETRHAYYADTLAKPILHALTHSRGDVENKLIQILRQENPELYSFISQKYWTTEQLCQVPDAPLAKALSGYPVEDRAKLIYGIPTAMRTRLIELAPPGMARTILNDLIERAEKRNLSEELENAQTMAREFVEGLRKSAENGDFALIPAASSIEVNPVSKRREAA